MMTGNVVADVMVLREQLANVKAKYDAATARVAPGVSRVLAATNTEVFTQISDVCDDLDELDIQMQLLTATLVEYRAALSRMLDLLPNS